MRKIAVISLTLLSGLISASAQTNVHVYQWYRMGEASAINPAEAYLYDSSTNGFTMATGFDNSAPYLGNAPAITNIAVGGPLGPNGIYSTSSSKQRFQPNNNGGYWGMLSGYTTSGTGYNYPFANLPTKDLNGVLEPGAPAAFNPGSSWNFPTNRNWVVEGWILPVGHGNRDATASFASIFEVCGTSYQTGAAPGGVGPANATARTNAMIELWGYVGGTTTYTNGSGGDGGTPDGSFYIQCYAVGPVDTNLNAVNGMTNAYDTNGLPWNYQLGPSVQIKTLTSNSWTHLAVVRDDTAPLSGTNGSLVYSLPTFYTGETGTVTWYVNGVAQAVTNASRVWQPPVLSPNNGTPITESFQTNARPYFGNGNNQNATQGKAWVNYGNGIPTGTTGSGQSGNRQFSGYYDEWRLWSFDPGTFSTNLLLLRTAAGPGIIHQPENVSVYQGGSATFQVQVAFDTANTFQWYKNGSAISGANKFNLIMAPGSFASGDQFYCQLANGSGTRNTTTNTVTIIANNTSVQNSYHTAVTSESSLISYWPGDSDTGNTLTDVKGVQNGTILGNATLDANTNWFSFGQGLVFNREGEWSYGVNDQVNIPNNNGAYDFTNGFGTIEAVLYLDPAAVQQPTLYGFPMQNNGFTWLCTANFTNNVNKNIGYTMNTGNQLLTANYVLSADANGHISFFAPCASTANVQDSAPISWSVPGGTLGKKIHVAITFDNGSNVTCYANGINLGTQVPPGALVGTNANIYGQTNIFCVSPYGTNLPLTIGASTYAPTMNNGAGIAQFVFPSTPANGASTFLAATNEGYIPNQWYGTIDEVAMYSTNLSPSTIASHAFKYFNGGSSQPASVSNLTPSKSMYAKGTQTFKVQAGGEPPYTYQWYTSSSTNTIGTAVAGATNSTLTLSNILSSVSVRCVVQGSIGSPVTNNPIFISITTPTVGSYADQVMSNAPVAFFRFNEAGGTTAYDWAGSHDGTYSGLYANNQAGPTTGESAVHFTPTQAGGGYVGGQVTVPWAPEFNGMNALTDGQVTYEMWVKLDSTNTDQCPLSSRLRGGNNKAGIVFVYGWDGLGTEKDAVSGGGDGAPNFGADVQTGCYGNVNQYQRHHVFVNPYSGSLVNTNSVYYNNGGYQPNLPTNVWHHWVMTWVTNGTVGGTGVGTSYSGSWIQYLDGYAISTNNNSFSPFTTRNNSNYSPNRQNDLVIGNWGPGQPEPTIKPWFGSVGDVAIYNYPLSQAQVQNHYSSYYTPATNQVAPNNVSTNEAFNSVITLTAVVSGNGNSYQWFHVVGGVSNQLSSSTLNPDGSLHYPPVFNGIFDVQGVDAPTLVITQPTTADAGQYVLVTYNIKNVGGQIQTTSGGNVSVTPDTTAPAVTAVAGLGQFIPGYASSGPAGIQLRFNKRLSANSAQNTANYTVSGGVTVNSAILSQSLSTNGFGGDERIVTLLTSQLTQGSTYTVNVSGIQDLAATPNTIAPVAVTFVAPTLKHGLTWDFYPNITGGTLGITGGSYDGSIAEFQDGQDLGYSFGIFTQVSTNTFPFVPEDETTLANFDTTQLNSGGTGLGNNLIYGTGTAGTGLDANFGAIISGWITPTRTDDYTLFLKADDGATLWLSPDNTPANLEQIAQASGVVSSYNEPGGLYPNATATIFPNLANNAPIHLVAGQSYFVELLQNQAGGNSYASVAWRSATGPDSTTPAGSLQPISGQYLTSYSQALPVLSISSVGGNAVLTWTGYGHLVQSSSLSTPTALWAPVAGNPTSPYTVAPSAGQMFYRIVK